MRYKKSSEPWSPSAESLNLIDEIAQNVKPDADSMLAWYLEYVAFHRERFAYDVDYAKQYLAENSRVIEFGSIPPIVTLALARSQYHITGVDIAPQRFKSAISTGGGDVLQVNIETEQLPFSDGEFDGAIFNEIFEHLRINPIVVMKEVLRVIKPGGRLLLSTPNLTSLYGFYNLIFLNKTPVNIYNEYEKLETLNHMGHVRIYTPVEAGEFLGRIGFNIERVIYRGYYKVPYKAVVNLVKTGLLFAPRLRPYFSIIAQKPL